MTFSPAHEGTYYREINLDETGIKEGELTKSSKVLKET